MSRYEMQALEWVIVLLNCLLIVFPYILSLLDLGIYGKNLTCFSTYVTIIENSLWYKYACVFYMCIRVRAHA